MQRVSALPVVVAADGDRPQPGVVYIVPAGLLAMRRQAAVTIVQDEASSVVFGMPQAAQQLGAAAEVLGLAQISGGIRNAVARLVP